MIKTLTWQRGTALLLVASLATVAIGIPGAASPVTPDRPTSVALLNNSAITLQPAVRTPGPSVIPTSAVPSQLLERTREDSVSFNACTANFLRNDQGAVIGAVGAAHCVRSSSNIMTLGDTVAINRSDIQLDSATDIFYVGLNGHKASDVHTQLVRNYQRADVTNRSGTVTVMTGYPRFSNPTNEPVTLQLMLAGIVHWPNDPFDTIATLGNWNSQNQACTPGASGSGLYAQIDGYGYVIIGVLASRAEFEHVQTMPYSDDYGLELRQYFEQQLNRPIRAAFLCGFAPPTPA